MAKVKENERMIYLVTFYLLSRIVMQVEGQVGVTVCACQPSVYTFEINVTSTCPETNVIGNPGIEGVDCFQRGIGANSVNITDTVPIQISSISVLELDSQLQVLQQTPYSGAYQNGDTFKYTSLTADPANTANLTPGSMSAGLQIDLVGINQFEEAITNVWIILFTNECGFYPVLDIGDNVGWTTLIDFERPVDSICPAANQFPSDAPTAPSFAPGDLSSQPTPAQTSKPSVNDPTLPPSIECIPKPKLKGIRSKQGIFSKKKHKESGKSKYKKGSGYSEHRKGKYSKSSKHSSNYSFPDDTAVMSRGVGHDTVIPYCESVKAKKKSAKHDSRSKQKLVRSKRSGLSLKHSTSKHSKKSSKLIKKKENKSDKRSKLQKSHSRSKSSSKRLNGKKLITHKKTSKDSDRHGKLHKSREKSSKNHSGPKNSTFTPTFIPSDMASSTSSYSWKDSDQPSDYPTSVFDSPSDSPLSKYMLRSKRTKKSTIHSDRPNKLRKKMNKKNYMNTEKPFVQGKDNAVNSATLSMDNGTLSPSVNLSSNTMPPTGTVTSSPSRNSFNDPSSISVFNQQGNATETEAISNDWTKELAERIRADMHQKV